MYRTDERTTPTRLPARERLSGTLESKSASQRPTQSRYNHSSPRNEWKPIAVSSHSGTRSKWNPTNTSHTPSPRPPRESQTPHQEKTPSTHQILGDGSLHSNERRSALEHISQPTERIPLLQNGVANSASGRLQEVDIQYLEETLPLHRSDGSNNPSSSRLPQQPSTGVNEGILDWSHIRSLSEDRLHVSLRLGPLHNSDSGKWIQQSSRDHDVSPSTGLNLGRGKMAAPPAARKRILRSPTHGATRKKRRITKTKSSPRRKLMADAMKAGPKPKQSGAGQPRMTIIPASRRKGSDFRTDPNSLS